MFKAAVVSCLVLSVSACSWNQDRSKTLGGVVGGVLGAVLGSKVGSGTGRNVAMVVGASLGAMWGQDIAEGMSDIDKVFYERTTKDTLEYGKPGETSTWSNPDSGNSGTVSANETYQNDAGEDCRTFETTVQVNGEDRTGEGVACRMSDGTWQVQEEPV
ncbi:MAG TPA: RT0821/Lpp0805 family surface protein [Magnetovibrio sp.]